MLYPPFKKLRSSVRPSVRPSISASFSLSAGSIFNQFSSNLPIVKPQLHIHDFGRCRAIIQPDLSNCDAPA